MALVSNGSYARNVDYDSGFPWNDGKNVNAYTMNVPQSELQNLEKQANMSHIHEHEADSEPLQCLLIGLLKTSNYVIILGYEIWKKERSLHGSRYEHFKWRKHVIVCEIS